MTDKLTAIRLASIPRGAGLQDWGEHSVAEMIVLYRSCAQARLAEAQAILTAADDDFEVRVVMGSVVQRPVKMLQKGRTA